MEIIVAIKQVPDTTEAKIDPQTHTLIRKGLPNAINSFDEIAIEAAVRLKEKYDGNVTLITMGPPSAAHALKIGLSMGTDRAVLLSDKAFAGSDTWATALTLARAIEKIGSYDMLIFGKQSTDGDTAQVGPEVSTILSIPLATYVIDIQEIDIKKQTFTGTRLVEEGKETVRTHLPVLITANKGLAEPRYPTLNQVQSTLEKDIEIWGLKDIRIDADETGLKGSPTRVYRTFTPTSEHQNHWYSGTLEEMSRELTSALEKDASI